jgi:type IV secretion system protein VirD4
LLTGSILHLCYKARAERALTSLGALYEMLARGGRPLWTDMLKYGHINGQIHPVVAAVVRDMLDLPPSEAASVLGTARSCLKLRLQAAYG